MSDEVDWRNIVPLYCEPIHTARDIVDIGASFVEGFMSVMPHYIVYELQHPRKKPRGSIRRARRNR